MNPILVVTEAVVLATILRTHQPRRVVEEAIALKLTELLWFARQLRHPSCTYLN